MAAFFCRCDGFVVECYQLHLLRRREMELEYSGLAKQQRVFLTIHHVGAENETELVVPEDTSL